MTTTPLAVRTDERPTVDHTHDTTGRVGARSLAALRIVLGLVFLWPFLDKTFGLGYATPRDRAWIAGGTPSQGYLQSDAVKGPTKDLLASMASPVSDWLFMLGMLGVGLALVIGIGLRVAAVAGAFLMLPIYLASWPFGPGSNNPLVDQHLVYVVALVALAATAAGDTWGAGRPWARVIGRQTWLR
ncbi:DoxX family membrane protein [Sanguibacter suaedae]|uniref:DoxX family membrane protein n=1 Tax=Sanguibacter suaedae TaxID=2795737 RepID=A0A934I5V2_9MICO|nr:DoxX family membrane protein [Sanguibacter suaedae]MBI9115788.1 DoxX family membrane protein [Sanguibacter suaedae]